MSTKIELTLACGDYEIMRALKEGTVQPDGIDLKVVTQMDSPTRHWRFLRGREFDMAEVSSSSYVASRDNGHPFRAIPVFPHRRFRHGFVYINTSKGIKTPKDLIGKKVGVKFFLNSAALWQRGFLEHDYGVPFKSIEWFSELDEDIAEAKFPADLKLTRLQDGKKIVDLLVSGELDAVLHPDLIKPIREKDPRVGRLWPDYKTEEMNYFKKTGIYPIMHVVGIKQEIVDKYPWVPVNMYRALEESKAVAMERMENPRIAPIVWYREAWEEQEEIFQGDPWEYGLTPRNVHNLETLVSYSHEQGMIKRKIPLDELFLDVGQGRGRGQHTFSSLGMLVSGATKLERMRDGRAVYVGAERVDDVTAHPAFREGAKTVAGLYDLKADPARRDEFSFEEDGERISLYWLRCRTRDDLARRMRCCKAIAEATYGYIGRSPDQVSGLVTGLAMRPELLDGLHAGFGQNLLKYYDFARRNDLYLSFAVTPASGRKSQDLFPGQQRDDPNLQVVAEDDSGVTVSGMKMLATSAVYADEILIGNLTPIDDKLKSEAITAALPLNAPGLSLWSRQPYAQHVRHAADYPMSYRFDETDSVLVCDNVKIPWERVFLHNEAAMSRRIYIETPANCYQNHQSNIRFWAKMGLIVGVASRVCQANGTDKIPAVREQLGRLASLEALVGGLVHGQIDAWESWPEGYATPNRRIMYAALNWCQEHHTEIIDTLRTLLGGYPMVMPASIDVMTDGALRERFERWWKTPTIEAAERHKLYKLAWDLTGTEFAGRHMLYEKFYAGSSIVVRNQSDREAPWQSFHDTVDRLLAQIETPELAK